MRRNSDAPNASKRSVLADALDRLAPAIPRFEREAVLDHALDSEGLRKSAPETAVWLSLVAFIRHQMTDYDDLLDEGYDPESARHSVTDEIRAILGGWNVKRSLT